MSKSTKIIIAVVAIIAIIAIVVVILMNSKPKTNLETINSADDLVSLVNKIYEGQEDKVPGSLQTQTIDVTDEMMVKAFTGLDNGEKLQYLVASEPMISSQAYSFVLATVKDGVNANEIAEAVAKKQKNNIPKWICVSAEKVYTTGSGNIVCLVMSSEEAAKPIYERFKTLAGSVGKEFEKAEEEIELPPEMY